MIDLTQDRVALDGYRRGDRAILGRIFEDHAGQVARWASGGFSFRSGEERRRFDGFRSAVDVHDVVNEVFRTVFEERARVAYSGLTPLEGYIFVITRNIILRRLKIMDRDRPIDVDSIEALPSEELAPDERIAREEEVTMVREFLATLGEEEQRFVSLRFSEDRPQNEVGDQLGWSRKKVRLQETSIRASLTRFMLRRRGTRELSV